MKVQHYLRLTSGQSHNPAI